jgi:hypothetical protein
MLALPTTEILMDQVLRVLLQKAKEVIWKFSKFKSEKSIFTLRLTQW